MSRRKDEQYLPSTTPPSTGFMHMIDPVGRNTPDEIARVRDLISHQPDAHDLAAILGIPLDI